ncbi:MAG: DUF2284 domain-containing protein [Lachnospiraceae bacterium]|jgi:predicted metal-binding protein
MNAEKMIQLALDAGFTKCSIINTENLVFKPEYRKYCEENTCGNFGKNYACPPDCKSPEELKNKVLEYRKAVVFQLAGQVESAFAKTETMELKKKHMLAAWDVVDQYRAEGVEGYQILATACCLCPVCQKAEGKPCLHPEKVSPGMSAYCIDVTQMAAVCGMEMGWKETDVSYFSMYLFDKK